ncbi:protein trichome birefringence-like 43 [Chenopodium quinoa]|uniref:protein trichome birefringence-like 43 n=1 Tax=Chenopodium quinoa TaxID=63459 RepID=UPI000B772D9F|nr:protein trichome birefringence-like 43 [Chenopodium quinoa]
MELKISMYDSWKLLTLGTLVGCLLFLVLDKTHQNISLSIARFASLPIKASNFNINYSVGIPNEKTKQNCNIFDGRWVYKPEDRNASYDARNCPFVEEKMSCHKNGRPDFEFLKWRWEANDCEIPVFNGKDMLERLRNKRVILVGDSLNRNMWESLACLLHSSIPSSNVQLRDNSKVPRLFWKAKDYNMTVEFYWSPFLVDLNLNHESGKTVLVLDKLSPNSEMWTGADVMVFNSGFWWVQPGSAKRWDYIEYKGKLIQEMSMEQAYETGMKTWANWIEKNVDPNKTTVFFRSISAEHKTKTPEKWCYNKTKLALVDYYAAVYPKILVDIIERLIKRFSKSQVKYLNITKLSRYRIEAHPGIYRYKDWKNLTEHTDDIVTLRPDCSHWCLPGVPDTWNKLLYASLFFDL